MRVSKLFSLIFSLYSFITSLIKRSIRAALSFRIRSVTWPYFVQRKGGGGVPQAGLYGLYILSGPERVHGVCMAE